MLQTTRQIRASDRCNAVARKTLATTPQRAFPPPVSPCNNRCNPIRPQNTPLHAASSSQSTTTAADDDVPPPGCARYSIEVPRPIGLVLEENKNGTIIVAEIAPDGNAARTGMVQVGDQLIATSGLTYTTEQQYQVGEGCCTMFLYNGGQCHVGACMCALLARPYTVHPRC